MPSVMVSTCGEINTPVGAEARRSFRAAFESCCSEAGFMQAEPASPFPINVIEFFNEDLSDRWRARRQMKDSAEAV